MKNFIKLFSIFCILSLNFSCHQNIDSDSEVNLITEMRTSDCKCDISGDPFLKPVLINLEDDCDMDGQCCFDLRFSFAYYMSNGVLIPDVGFGILFTVDSNGLYHFCIPCDATCFTVRVYNNVTMVNDCFEFTSPCF